MTDKEKLMALLTEFGVGFVEHGDYVECLEGNAKIEGHNRFFTMFDFDEDGNFLSMGAWE